MGEIQARFGKVLQLIGDMARETAAWARADLGARGGSSDVQVQRLTTFTSQLRAENQTIRNIMMSS